MRENPVMTLPDGYAPRLKAGKAKISVIRVTNEEWLDGSYKGEPLFVSRTNEVRRMRVTGATKTWKREPGRFRTPVKYGMYESTYVTNGRDGFAVVGDGCMVVKMVDHE